MIIICKYTVDQTKQKKNGANTEQTAIYLINYINLKVLKLY